MTVLHRPSPGILLGASLVALLVVPFVTLIAAPSLQDYREAMSRAELWEALHLSLWTTTLSTAMLGVAGVPLAWWLARTRTPSAQAIKLVVDLPAVMPPAVVGIALLLTFGRTGWLGSTLAGLGVNIAFTPVAVMIAQLVVAAPFLVHTATEAFARVDEDTVIVARTLGASDAEVFWRVALPIAAPGIAAGVSMAWARALGEFGATLLFAGNLRGRTQTMPLAILQAVEADLRVAAVFAVVLSVTALFVLGLGRVIAGRMAS